MHERILVSNQNNENEKRKHQITRLTKGQVDTWILSTMMQATHQYEQLLESLIGKIGVGINILHVI